MLSRLSSFDICCGSIRAWIPHDSPNSGCSSRSLMFVIAEGDVSVRHERNGRTSKNFSRGPTGSATRTSSRNTRWIGVSGSYVGFSHASKFDGLRPLRAPPTSRRTALMNALAASMSFVRQPYVW